MARKKTFTEGFKEGYGKTGGFKGGYKFGSQLFKKKDKVSSVSTSKASNIASKDHPARSP